MNEVEYNLNADGTYMNAEQISEHMSNEVQIDEDTLDAIRNNDPVGNGNSIEVTMMFIEFARWIRNSYGLWAPDNPHVIKGDLGDGHPDGISHTALILLRNKLISRKSTDLTITNVGL